MFFKDKITMEKHKTNVHLETIVINGPTVKEIIHNNDTLTDLETSIKGSKPFVKTLRSLANLHNLVRDRNLRADFRAVINDFMSDWQILGGWLRRFSERHNYTVKKINSPAQKKKQHQMIVHWNSNNLK